VEDLRKFVICLVMLLLIASPANACIGARQAAMGWCGVAISDDATASYWNPAALVWAKDGFMYGSIWGSTDLAAKYGSFGFHYVDQWNKWYWQIGYGHQLNKNLAVGFNVGWAGYNNCYPPYNGPSADVSCLYRVEGFSFGVLAQNLVNIRPEIAYSTEFITLSAGIYDLLNVYSLRYFHVGVEICPFPILALRGGYNSDYEDLIYGAALKASFLTLSFVHIEGDDCFSVTCAF
jgi:hypothetical protein